MAAKGRTPEPWQAADVPLLNAMRGAMRGLVAEDTRFKAYFRLLDTPLLSELYVQGRGRLRHRRIQSRTRIVVEAYPSSGNTYCRQSLLLSNPHLRPDQICSHTHSPRIVLRAVRAQLPCLVVARDPRDAVSSTVQRFPGVSLETAFNYYEHYYRRIFSLKDHIVLAPFDVVVSDFSSLVEAVNVKFGVDFATEARVGVSRATVFADIDRRGRLKNAGKVREESVSRPSSRRMRSGEFLLGMNDTERRSMERALDSYHRCIDAEPMSSSDG